MKQQKSASKRTLAQFIDEDFATSAGMLNPEELLHLFAFNQLFQSKFAGMVETLKEYEKVLANELFRRSVNPYTYTAEDFQLVYREGREQQIRACRNLVQRFGKGAAYATNGHSAG